MVSLDDVFHLLAPERRRYALYCLERADGPLHVDELADQVAAWERDPSALDLAGEDQDDVKLTLEHRHLPSAAEAEFIEYDRDAAVVRLTGTPTEFRIVLAVARAIESPSSTDVVDLRDIV